MCCLILLLVHKGTRWLLFGKLYISDRKSLHYEYPPTVFAFSCMYAFFYCAAVQPLDPARLNEISNQATAVVQAGPKNANTPFRHLQTHCHSTHRSKPDQNIPHTYHPTVLSISPSCSRQHMQKPSTQQLSGIHSYMLYPSTGQLCQSKPAATPEVLAPSCPLTPAPTSAERCTYSTHSATPCHQQQPARPCSAHWS